MDTIGKRIAIERHEKGWTQGKLASELGIHQSQLSEIETNVHSPTWEQIEKIAEKLEVPVYKILPANIFHIHDNEFKDNSGVGNTYHQNQDKIMLSELIKSLHEMTTALKETGHFKG